ncbi:flagellar hook-associated protein FlgK [Neobacillus drentensis]|uniref:flagellar hook-associated protein FlgK n=1 Tax=Neobacillus drentensis TaxID=220684 RepID=UPI002866EE1C|nr:flagellar hook-associated protein FlgK [Neobacillus drentensis]MDR7235706.1 flagellar hook-associated protein 1 FlgK [Neobacillus drentensis]
MTSTFHGIELGKRGLAAQQTALSTTGHNIANANTVGYTRQRAEMQSTPALSINKVQLGTGVNVNSLVRLREKYLDTQYRDENQKLGYYEAKSDALSKIEDILNEPTDDGLAHVLDEFWKGWQELAKEPDSLAARAVVRQNGVAVTETFQYISDSLKQMQNDLKDIIGTKVKEVNSLAKQISELNGQISSLVANDYQPNDLYDHRDVLIDQLSKLVDVKVVPIFTSDNKDTGMIQVSVGGSLGSLLVDGYKPANPLEINITNEIDLGTDIKIGGTPIQLASGELLGRIESYGIKGGAVKSTIPYILDQINNLATEFKDAVNAQHQMGYSLEKNNDGKIEVVKANDEFFTWDDNNSLVVNPKIINPATGGLYLIAAAAEEGNSASSSTGNGNNALEIANIKSKVGDQYRNIIAQLGIESQESQRMQNNTEAIVNQVENRRQSISGVSLDEEMANMIKFQQAYNAAARMVTAMDQCLDKVINGMGRVGL